MQFINPVEITVDPIISSKLYGIPPEINSLQRIIPPGLPTLPMQPLVQGGKWMQALPNDAITAMIQYHAALYNSANTYYVKPTTGSDANTGLTKADPFATVAKAMRTATGSASKVVMLEDAEIAPFDLRATDASQTTEQIKILYADGHKVIIKDTGPDLSTQTWAVDGTYTNCYTTTLTLSGSAAPTKILQLDLLDDEGEPTPLALYASAAALDVVNSGYYYDSVGKVLWININGRNINQNRNKLRALYTSSSGVSRILAYGSKIGFSGVRFEGVVLETLDLSSRSPEIWLHNCDVLWSYNKGLNLTVTGKCVASDSFFYANKFDAINAFAPSTTGKGLLQTIRCRFKLNGDIRIFAADGTLQGESSHGGSDHISWGNIYEDNNGPGIQDTCLNNYDDVSWIVGCRFYAQTTGIYNSRMGSTATTASRKAYFDTCDFKEYAAGDLYFDANSTIYTYGTNESIVGGGTVTAYSPDAPV